jgi:outer membrane scaffolding protein for murein synthesis (MipA/OmpV family)
VIEQLSKRLRVLAAAVAVAVAAPVVAAADPLVMAADPADGDWEYVVHLGGGVKYKPKYPGADDYIFVPYPLAAASRFYVPGLGQYGGKTSGLTLFPSFDYHGKREASDSPSLTGTDTVDWALEAGAGVAYRYDWLRGFIQARQGFNGHHGQVVDFGLDIITEPMDRLTLVVGPRATWASEDFMSTYFGVTPAEAAASGGALTAYSAGAGFESAGVTARVSYGITDRTTVHLQGEWERLIGDAADSPIVGDDNQFSIGIGLTRKFSFDLFK